jgi:hypothetical protein
MDPKITLKGHGIKSVDSHKILGLIFDKRLDWLLRIHQMLVLSTLEYGSSAYSSPRPRNLKKLDAVHHSGIRMALGAFLVWIHNPFTLP